MRRLLLLLLLLAGCQTFVPVAKTLDEATKLTESRDDAALAQLDVDCRLTNAGCGQLRRLKAEACRRLADQPGAALRPRLKALDCAAANFNAALAVYDKTREAAASPDELAPALLEVLAQRRDLTKDPDDALARNGRLALRAQAIAHYPSSAGQAGLVFGAEAAFQAAQLPGATGGCESLARAAALLGQARPQGTAVEGRAQVMSKAIPEARTARGCAS